MSAFSPPYPTHSLLPLQQSSFASLTLEHTLEDLCARFIVNLPAEELESMDRVCFQIEQAHWYYEDFVRPAAVNPSLLPSYGLKAFSLLMFRSCPLLHDLIPTHPQIWMSFMAYKERVPVCGAILISEFWDKVLLVKGWQKGASWSFPRGKINKEEAEGMCAIREVLEETGYDLSASFPTEQLYSQWVEEEGAERIPYYVELVIKEQKIRLYFIPGVEEDTYFETRTRKEISKIDWFKLSDLPTWSRDKKGKNKVNLTAADGSQKQAKFYMVTPFISHLKLWIERNKPKNLRPRANGHQQQHRSTSQAHSRPANPTPHGATTSYSTSAHQLPPHLLDSDVGYHPPTYESDLDQSTSPSIGSTEEETDADVYGYGGARRPTQFETTEEGTQALKAFFFGGEPASAVESELSSTVGDTLFDLPPSSPSPELPDPRSSLAINNSVVGGAGGTPPQVAYERQSSFVQPRPKPTPQHTSTLLALLTDKNPVASPPPAKAPRRSSRRKEAASAVVAPPQTQGPTEGGSLLNILRGGSSSHLSASRDSTSPAPSILFADSAPPPEAAGFGTTHVATEAERGDDEREEKRLALMRALFSVASRTPPPAASAANGTPAVPESIRSLFKGPPRAGDGEEVEQRVDVNGWSVSEERSFDAELDGLRRRHEESSTAFASPTSFSPEQHTPTAERWRVESLEQEHHLPLDGGAGGGSRGLGGFDAWSGEYERMPYPGEASPLPPTLVQRVSRVDLNATSPEESSSSEGRRRRSAAQESGRAAASSNLLSILNQPGNKSTVNLNKQASFSSASASGSTSAYSRSPQAPALDLTSHVQSADTYHASTHLSPLASQAPALPRPPQQQQFTSPPISAAYSVPQSQAHFPPPPFPQHPHQLYASGPPPHPQQQQQQQQQAFSGPPLSSGGGGGPHFLPLLPMGYPGVPMGMSMPPPMMGMGGVMPFGAPPFQHPPHFPSGPPNFAPPPQHQQGQGQGQFFASPPSVPQALYSQQQQQQQPQQFGAPPPPPHGPPPQQQPPQQQQHANANQLLGLFNTKPATSRVG